MKTLAIGMTTAPRTEGATRHDYVSLAVASLRAAGFTQRLHLFAEPDSPNPSDMTNVFRRDNLGRRGCFPNWKEGFAWLTNNVEADWYLMLQDDCAWCQSGAARLQAAIDNPDFAGVGYLSPYTSPAMLAKRHGVPGWQDAVFYNRAFIGAQAMCFPKASADLLQTLDRYVKHTHHRKLDVVVGNAIRRDANLRILVHAPSICQHVGAFSTLGRHKIRGIAWGRKGFQFSPDF